LRELGAVGDGYTALGTAFLDLPGLSGWLAVIGTHGVSMLVAGLAWVLASAIRAFTAGTAGRLEAPLGMAVAALAVLVVTGSGGFLSSVEWTTADGPTIALTIVQDATDKRRPWSVAERDSAEDRLLAAIRSTPQGGVVVTPEGHFADPLPTRPEAFWQTLRDEVNDRGIHVLVGMPQRALDGDERQVFNAIVQVAPDRFALYAKERLVPGGESLPMAGLFSALYDNAFQGRADTPRTGEHAAPPELTQPLFVAGTAVGASICHELSFTATIARRARGSAWLFNAADDAWIPSATYRSQMTVIARARALELAKPLLRVSDGGSSMLVDANGRIAQAAPTNEAVTRHWRVQPRKGSTPYERHAQALALAPVAALALLFVAGLAMRARRLLPSDRRLP
jgi:apolipoprotein N-acyltransferase